MNNEQIQERIEFCNTVADIFLGVIESYKKIHDPDNTRHNGEVILQAYSEADKSYCELKKIEDSDQLKESLINFLVVSTVEHVCLHFHEGSLFVTALEPKYDIALDIEILKIKIN